MDSPRPRCAWAGADRPKPDPLMVAYHDDEWGRPVHDDIELFERLALESFQAGLSWSTILRKRDAFRSAFLGFDPAVVARFDAADRDRLMADAGIVRNGAKIDATIGNAAAVLAIAEEFGSFDAYLATMVAATSAAPAADRPVRRHPGHDRGLGRAVGRPQASRLALRRLDHRLRLHAECRPGRRPPAGLLPVWRGQVSDPGRGQRSRRSNAQVAAPSTIAIQATDQTTNGSGGGVAA